MGVATLGAAAVAVVVAAAAASLFGPVACVYPREMRVGVLYDDLKTPEERILKLAIEDIDNFYRRGFHVETEVEIVRDGDKLTISQKVCQILGTGVWALLGPRSASGSEMAQSVCDTMEVPHIQTRFDFNHRRQDILVNLYPHHRMLGQALVDLVVAYRWKEFTIIYEDDDGLARVAPLLTVHQTYTRDHEQSKLYTVTLRQLTTSLDQKHQPDWRPILRQIKNSGENNFVLDCSFESLHTVLLQAQQVGLMVAENSFIISNLDLHNIDILPFSYGETNITGFRLIDLDDQFVRETLRLHERWPYDDNPLTEALLMYDAMLLLATTVRNTIHSNISAESLDCDKKSWHYGHSLVNFMKSETNVRGLSGKILFDNEGFRTNFVLDVVEVKMGEGIQKVGTWNSTMGLNLTRSPPELEQTTSDSLINKTFIVLIALTNPYGMRKEDTKALVGNDQYEGYGVEVIHELSMSLGFNYTLELQLDNKYGSKNQDTGEWNGMIRQIMDNKADLAITDLTITAEREEAVDFTMPFMNTGISILYKIPTKGSTNFFSFMAPFSTDVWAVMFFAYVGVSLMLFVMGRICPYEWTNPYPCIEEPDELENQFSFKNSLWFTIGSLMQQGSDVAPIAVSTRMVAGIWWFFTLIMVSSYTANLAAFLTIEAITDPFKSAYDLEKQNVIQYGAKAGGSTLNFFRDSTEEPFIRMFQFMNSTPGVLPNSNEEGLEKVKKENYAFFMESAAIEFIVERHCQVKQIGGLLDSKGYGIAMKKGSPYRNTLSASILKLQETGRLMALKDKWWKEERGGGVCASKDTGGSTSGLQLANVGGVFVVLVGGIILAMFMTLLELLWSVCQTSIKEKVSFRQELMEELKFIAKFHGSTKPVRKYNHDEDNLPLGPYPYGFVVNQPVEQKENHH